MSWSGRVEEHDAKHTAAATVKNLSHISLPLFISIENDKGDLTTLPTTDAFTPHIEELGAVGLEGPVVVEDSGVGGSRIKPSSNPRDALTPSYRRDTKSSMTS